MLIYLRPGLIILPVLLLLATVFSACLGSRGFRPKYEFSAAYERRPQFWLEYHPYPPEQRTDSHPRVRAIPQNEGWTDLRMKRELTQFRQAGFAALLLHVKPEIMASEHFAERLQKFHALSSSLAPGMGIALVLSPGVEGLRLSVQNTMQFVERLGFLHLPASLKVQGEPILFFGGHIELIEDYQGTKRQASLPEFLHNVQNRACTVSVAGPPSEKQPEDLAWRRKKGEFFASQLQEAFQSKARIIYIKSWNNYAEDNFMEPNSLDQDLMMQILELAQKALP